MAAINDPNMSDDKNPMPSVISSSSSVSTGNLDDRFMLPGDMNIFAANNHQLDFNMRLQQSVIMEIIKCHPLRHAFNMAIQIPAFYLHPFWHSLTYHPIEGNYHFTTQIDEYDTRVTPTRLRRVLRLPAPDAFPGRKAYEDPALEEDLCRDFLALGYNVELPHIG